MNKALEIYNRVPKTHNCAQSVAAGVDREDLVEPLRSCGGGRAPEGVCGALHAALALTAPEHHAELRKRFAAKAGSLHCRVLKQELKYPCTSCVELGSALVRDFQQK